VQETIDFFETEGVATKIEETGKIFPVSNKAGDVLHALLRRMQRSGAVLALGEPVTEISVFPRSSPEGTGEPGFILTTPLRALNASKVILTTGGQSYPGSGTTGDGYRFAARFGHCIVPPRPALVPLTTNVPWVADLRGITLADVAVRIVDEEKTLARRRGSLLFAHFGLSGPVILDVSRAVSAHFLPSDSGERAGGQPASLLLEVDFLPALSDQTLSDWLRDESLASGKKQLALVLAQQVPRRLCETLLEQAGLAKDRKAAALTRDERQRLVRAVKRLHIPLTGTLGFKKAEVTAGGVALDEIDSRTMQSKLVPNLYFAGEILDLDGPIGGYNFQSAWSTGWLAGAAV
jgi:predicted Rossmann fold flavoprotein